MGSKPLGEGGEAEIPPIQKTKKTTHRSNWVSHLELTELESGALPKDTR
jgi:hypothetical protein